MGDNFSGMAIKDSNVNFMLVNSGDIRARQHFTICHELYHLFVQEKFEYQICKVGLFDKKDQDEFYADWFSSYLLMPEDGIFELLPKEEMGFNKISINTIVKMEQYFGVSRTALLNRLMFIDMISKSKVIQLKEPGTIKRSAMMMGYTEHLYESSNEGKVIGDYGARTKKLYDKEQISETDYYGLMRDIGIDLDKNLMEDAKTEG